MNGRILYKEICEDIVSHIRSGKYKAGELLPPQQQLCEQYGASLITVKKALERAEKRGFVKRCKGRRAEICVDGIGDEESCSHKILLLDILGKNREEASAATLASMKQRICLDVENGWNGQMKQAIISHLPANTDVMTAAYYHDDIFNEYEMTVLPEVDRLAIFGGISDQLLHFLKERNKQIAIFGNYESAYKNRVCCVRNNDRDICYKAVKYLISIGHKRIAYIGSASGGDFAERYKGYQEAMVSSDLPLSGYLIRWSRQATADEGYSNMSDILCTSFMFGLPTAVFCADDNIAYGALMAIRDNQLRCPEDISIFGVNNYPEICENTSPTLSSIEKNFRQVGIEFAKVLQRKEWKNDTHVVQCSFVIRESIQERKPL